MAAASEAVLQLKSVSPQNKVSKLSTELKLKKRNEWETVTIERQNGVVEVYAPVKNKEKTERATPALDLNAAPYTSHQSHQTSEENSYLDYGFSAMSNDRFIATPDHRGNIGQKQFFNKGVYETPSNAVEISTESNLFPYGIEAKGEMTIEEMQAYQIRKERSQKLDKLLKDKIREIMKIHPD